jgi:Ca2+-binding EF-hand superfamily protein
MKIPLILAALFCSFALMSFAEDAVSQERLRQLFNNFDTNRDGSVSLVEYKGGMVGQMAPERIEGVFKQKDRNGDGKLSLAELLSTPQDPAKTEKKDDRKSDKKDDKQSKNK